MLSQSLQPHGRFFPIDQNGYIINDTDWSTIPKHWQNVIIDIIAAYQKELANNLIAVYVRGSVARNLAIDGFSDIDTFALIKSDQLLKWAKASFQGLTSSFLQKKYVFVKEIEMQLVSYNSNTFLAQNPKVAMLIQTQSLCVFGKDIIPTLSQYLPNRSVCLNYHWLEEDIKAYLQKTTDELTIADHQAILKVIIRSGFELVIEREKQFLMTMRAY